MRSGSKTDMLIRFLMVLLLSLRIIGIVYADHCPEESITGAKPETQLAGIDFHRGNFPKVLSQYGKPASSYEEAGPSYPAGSGEARYSWKVGSSQLEVFTMFYREGGKRVESTTGVRIDGVAPVVGMQARQPQKLSGMGEEGGGPI